MSYVAHVIWCALVSFIHMHSSLLNSSCWFSIVRASSFYEGRTRAVDYDLLNLSHLLDDQWFVFASSQLHWSTIDHIHASIDDDDEVTGGHHHWPNGRVVSQQVRAGYCQHTSIKCPTGTYRPGVYPGNHTLIRHTHCTPITCHRIMPVCVGCIGSGDIQCCPPPTPSCAGQCQDDSLPCNGTYASHQCPGGNNIRCCTCNSSHLHPLPSSIIYDHLFMPSILVVCIYWSNSWWWWQWLSFLRRQSMELYHTIMSQAYTHRYSAAWLSMYRVHSAYLSRWWPYTIITASITTCVRSLHVQWSRVWLMLVKSSLW